MEITMILSAASPDAFGSFCTVLFFPRWPRAVTLCLLAKELSAFVNRKGLIPVPRNRDERNVEMA
jgi:hypothetical protein